MKRFLIKTEGVYAAILDEASWANVDGFMRQELALSYTAATAQDSKGEHLYFFNDRLTEHARRGDLLAWTFLFHGVYQASVEVLDEINDTEGELPRIQNVGAETVRADLVCKSGRFVIVGLDELGRPSPHIVVVEPARYRVTLTCNDIMEAKHSFLEDTKDYPIEDAADWKITLQPIQATANAPSACQWTRRLRRGDA